MLNPYLSPYIPGTVLDGRLLTDWSGEAEILRGMDDVWRPTAVYRGKVDGGRSEHPPHLIRLDARRPEVAHRVADVTAAHLLLPRTLGGRVPKSAAALAGVTAAELSAALLARVARGAGVRGVFLPVADDHREEILAGQGREYRYCIWGSKLVPWSWCAGEWYGGKFGGHTGRGTREECIAAADAQALADGFALIDPGSLRLPGGDK
jgi:hypothetical protein